MQMSLNAFTEEEAKALFCHRTMSLPNPEYCRGKACIAFTLTGWEFRDPAEASQVQVFSCADCGSIEG